MANISKNLDTTLSQAINGPKVDGIPLYSRVDGSQEIGFNSGQSGKSEKWERASLTTFTSPTNIRKVFIAGDRVVINLYKPAIVKGKPDTQGCWREFKLSGDNNIHECAMKGLSYSQNMSKYYMEKQIDSRAEAPNKVTIRGYGLGAISKPWVLSNIEEVYFDWSILASETYKNAGLGCDKMLETYIANKRGYTQSDIALQMFMVANSANIKDIRSRFPRLKCVGMISELGKILGAAYDRGKPGLDSVEDSILLWSKRDINIALIKQSNSLIAMNELKEDIPIYNTNFSLRDGIYRFDRDILRPYFADYERRVKDHLRAEVGQRATKSDTAEVTADEKIEKSELEILLDNLTETRCLADAKSVLILSLAGATVSEVNTTFKSMSDLGEKKYRALIS